MKMRKLLAIDDDNAYRTLTKRFFSQAGYSVETAGTGVEGINKAADIQPDVILLDFALPDMTGADVLDILNLAGKTRTIPVILITGRFFTHEERSWLMRRKNLKGLVGKPASFENVNEQINALLVPAPGCTKAASQA